MSGPAWRDAKPIYDRLKAVQAELAEEPIAPLMCDTSTRLLGPRRSSNLLQSNCANFALFLAPFS